MSAQTHQVGAHFKALNKGIPMAAMITLEKFFFISSVSEAQCNEHNHKNVCVLCVQEKYEHHKYAIALWRSYFS